MTKRTPTAPEAPEYPQWWDWDENGNTASGTFVRAGRGYTQHGDRPFVVLEIDGEERTVWLHQDVLRNLFAREVQRRPDKRIAAGERITLWRLNERTSGNGRTYIDFRGAFPDSPEVTQSDIFGPPPESRSDDKPATEEQADATAGSGDGDIPF